MRAGRRGSSFIRRFAGPGSDHVWLQDPVPKMMIVGELQDGLVFETAFKKLTGRPLTHWIIPKFAAQSRHRLIFLTKSTEVQYALELDATPQAVFSWSVNAEEVALRWEHGTPPPSKRFAAAASMKRSRMASADSARPDGPLPALAIRLRRRNPADQSHRAGDGNPGCSPCHVGEVSTRCSDQEWPRRQHLRLPHRTTRSFGIQVPDPVRCSGRALSLRHREARAPDRSGPLQGGPGPVARARVVVPGVSLSSRG